MVQLTHPYTATGKIIALTLWTFVGKVMSLLLNMWSRFVMVFSSMGEILTQLLTSVVHLDMLLLACFLPCEMEIVAVVLFHFLYLAVLGLSCDT